MANGYKLQSGVQTGTLSLNGIDIDFNIKYSSDFERYYIDIYQDGIGLILGAYLNNGTDLLYNKEHLGLGSSLMYRGYDDLSEGYLIYE